MSDDEKLLAAKLLALQLAISGHKKRKWGDYDVKDEDDRMLYDTLRLSKEAK